MMLLLVTGQSCKLGVVFLLVLFSLSLLICLPYSILGFRVQLFRIVLSVSGRLAQRVPSGTDCCVYWRAGCIYGTRLLPQCALMWP